MLNLVLNKSRTNVYDLTLETESGSGVVLASGDTVRIIGYRRTADTPVFNLLSSAAATANGSKVTVTSTVPTPAGTTPTVRLNLGQADLTTLVPGAPLKIEITVQDADGLPTGCMLGPIHAYAWVCTTSGAAP